MAKKTVKKRATVQTVPVKKGSIGLAIISLILNVIFISGFGTLIAGKSKTGAWQMALWVLGAIFVSVAYSYEAAIFYIGSPLIIAAWIWGIVTGIKLIQEAR